MKGLLILTYKTRRTLVVLAALAAPAAALATPAIAQATPTGIDFAANASGAAIPAGWATNQAYYANPNGGGDLTVFYTGASAGDTVDLYDNQFGAPVELGSASTAGSDGTGSFTFASSGVGPNDLIDLSDSTATTGNANFRLWVGQQPLVSDAGPALDGNGNPLTGSESMSVSQAVPDEPVELYVNGTLDSSLTANADDNGSASFNLTGLTAGYNTVQAASEDGGGTPASSTAFHFSTYPIVAGASWTGGFNFANTAKPTLTLDGVAPDASAINVYANDGNGDITQLSDGADYSYTLGASGTATVTFLNDVNPTDGYAFTQVDGPTAVESDTSSVPYLTINLDSAAPTVQSDFVGSLTNETQPKFYASSDGNDYGYLGFEYRLTQNGQTVATSPVLTSHTGGEWQPPTLADGTYTVTAVTVDAFGELGTTTSTPLTFTVDTTGPTTPAPSPASLPSTREVMSSLNTALRTVRGKTATTVAIAKAGGYTLGFKAPSAGTVTIKWYAGVKDKKTLIASVIEKLNNGGKAKVKVKLDAAGRKLLKGSKGSVKISESGSFTPKGGKKTSTSDTIKLKH